MHVMVWIPPCVCVYVCVWMNVDETEKAALCIAVHHRQYPCFSSIHIHTQFSYPLQEQEKKKCKCIWVYSKERFESKEKLKRKHRRREKQRLKKECKKEQISRKIVKGSADRKYVSGCFTPNHSDLLHCNQCIRAWRRKSKYSSWSDECCSFFLCWGEGWTGPWGYERTLKTIWGCPYKEENLCLMLFAWYVCSWLWSLTLILIFDGIGFVFFSFSVVVYTFCSNFMESLGWKICLCP